MTLNQAIYKVITTQYKKDMGEDLEIVKDAGFEVRKITGGWEVYNPETRRSVWVSYNNYKTYIRYGWNKRVEISFHFDFENNLRTPHNLDWEYVREQRRDWRGETKKKMERLHDAKWTIGWRKKDIENTKKKIEELQRELMRQMRSEIDAESRLDDLRKELKLKK